MKSNLIYIRDLCISFKNTAPTLGINNPDISMFWIYVQNKLDDLAMSLIKLDTSGMTYDEMIDWCNKELEQYADL